MDQTLDKIQPVSLWPTTMFVSQLVIDREKLTTEIYNIKNASNTVSKSNYGGWQSDINLYTNHYFSDLVAGINRTIQLITNRQDIEFKQMWACVNKHKDLNTVHANGNEFHLSGVYYVQVPDNSGDIAFRDPRPAAINSSTHSIFGYGDTELFRPVNNMLLIFPSFLEHFVLPNESHDDRVTISFDIRFGDL